MQVPIRCFTCGKVIGQHWEEFKKGVEKGEDPAKLLDKLGVTRYCCRRMLLSHEDIIDEIKRYPR